MMYETSQHRTNELDAGHAIACAYNCCVRYTVTEAGVDYLILRGAMVAAVGEYKRRNNVRAEYPTLTIDCSKIDTLLAVAQALCVPAILFIEWNDGLYACRITGGYNKITQSLRDPRDEHDVDDAVYEIPISDFVLVR